ncbi:hypothetical protein EUX98_g5493 [Antrodiella citrinella]|uniref:Uncharacterized protein n=1 Tax=Antrodiella citrinella TaxID=2447956 RepID=A0A4S4MZ71_9APHY|nr:hypothetical protein EUX98_g5493 [Antrodiella citrinella]
MKFSITSTLVSLLAIAASGVLAQDAASITAPTAGQHIAPGSNFTFSFSGRADYGVSSYAYSVWLLNSTAVGEKVKFEDVFTNGWYFGRYDYANYPAVPYTTAPAPAELTMPDFSKAPGGWGSGKSVSNYNASLVVIEEWADGTGSVGRNFGFTGVHVVYNATK